jgi:hypothetical protein
MKARVPASVRQTEPPLVVGPVSQAKTKLVEMRLGEAGVISLAMADAGDHAAMPLPAAQKKSPADCSAGPIPSGNPDD